MRSIESPNDLALTLYFAQVALDGRSKRADQIKKHGGTKRVLFDYDLCIPFILCGGQTNAVYIRAAQA